MSPTEKRLSSTVLEMKFMQRTKRKLEAREKKKKEAELKKECFGDNEEFTPSPVSKQCDYQFSSDLTFLENLKFGRMSFKGCNPEVEKLMVYHERKRMGHDSDTDSDNEKDVGDVEMATTLRGAAATMSRKFSKGEKAVKTNKGVSRPAPGLDEISSNERLNFTDVRKRGTKSEWGGSDESPPKKFRKSS
ncbi:unnamed protein product [Cylicocyclus nassatus]|uniref:M-phase phosphoprotein 6 n=1 Tax=Cylicocyclus nassatus TaxID=53992 RepID=A0AA36HAL6_CYLNA|nr:unnamed protein product [Cylicocyclus nassatus]